MLLQSFYHKIIVGIVQKTFLSRDIRISFHVFKSYEYHFICLRHTNSKNYQQLSLRVVHIVSLYTTAFNSGQTRSVLAKVMEKSQSNATVHTDLATETRAVVTGSGVALKPSEVVPVKTTKPTSTPVDTSQRTPVSKKEHLEDDMASEQNLDEREDLADMADVSMSDLFWQVSSSVTGAQADRYRIERFISKYQQCITHVRTKRTPEVETDFSRPKGYYVNVFRMLGLLAGIPRTSDDEHFVYNDHLFKEKREGESESSSEQ